MITYFVNTFIYLLINIKHHLTVTGSNENITENFVFNQTH